MAAPLVMGQEEIAKLAELRERAARETIDMQEVAQKLNTDPAYKKRHMDRMTELSVEIPFGFLVTFSVEQNHPDGTMRHMSMSSPDATRLPTPEAVWMAAEALGFVGSLKNCAIWLEDLTQGRAVNLVQPLALTIPAEGPGAVAGRERMH